MATLLDAWCNSVNGMGWLSVYCQWVRSLICSLYFSVAACETVLADPHLIYTLHIAGALSNWEMYKQISLGLLSKTISDKTNTLTLLHLLSLWRRDRQTDRQTDKDRQTDRQTQTQTDKDRDRERERQRELADLARVNAKGLRKMANQLQTDKPKQQT